jgi:hypothetical protein
MNTQHTPGPWEIGISPSGHRAIFAEFCDGATDIATPIGMQDCDGDDWTAIDDGEAQANIRLICAAPDMFDALQAIVDAYGDRDTLLIAQCKAALAKAKGEA